MCFETLCIKSGQICNVMYHDARFNATRQNLFYITKPESLKELINIPTYLDLDKIYRCRVLYTGKIEKVEFIPYKEKVIQKIKLLTVPADFSYTYKWADRSFFSKLLANNADVDEVLMVQNGCITDCTIANVALFDGTEWYTPSTPMLHGTRRAQLLETKRIKSIKILLTDLTKFNKLVLINTFRDLSEVKAICVSDIIRI